MSFPLPAGRRQRREPRVPGPLLSEASSGPQRHPDGGTPPVPHRDPPAPSAGPGTAAAAASLLVSQPAAPEEAATLRQVGKRSVGGAEAQRAGRGEQTRLRTSGIGERPRRGFVPQRPGGRALLLQTVLLCVFSPAGRREAAGNQRDTTEEAEGGREGGGDTEDAAQEARSPPRGGGLLLLGARRRRLERHCPLVARGSTYESGWL